MTSVLVVDNYDSFVYTLNGYLQQLGAETEVVRNDSFSAADARARIREHDAVLVSPGPGAPRDAGVSIDVVHAAVAADVPLLGVCLGHQAIAVAAGGTVGRATAPRHGDTSELDHDGRGVFAGLPQGLAVTRYHSLVAHEDALPGDLVVTARARDDGHVMAVRHRTLAVEGVQFHPESVLTEHGLAMLAGFFATHASGGAAS